MKAIIGLGNPGLAYKNTRHNLGFMVADALLQSWKQKFKSDSKTGCLKAKLNFSGEVIFICKPLSYMNLSGKSAKKIVESANIAAGDMLVVCDDVNLELGEMRIRVKGASGGHKGLASIIEELGTENFPRLRIGVASPKGGRELSDYVLSAFSRAEQKTIAAVIEKAKEAIECWAENGIQDAMNKFN